MYPMSRGQSYTIAWHVWDAERSYLPVVGALCVCVCVLCVLCVCVNVNVCVCVCVCVCFARL